MNPVPVTAETLPEGEYAIVEVIGHRTLVGRISEVARFGTTLLQVEPLYAEFMLPAVMIGGGSIYQLTPCPPDVAWRRRSKSQWDLPDTVKHTLPAPEADKESPAFLHDEHDEEDEHGF